MHFDVVNNKKGFALNVLQRCLLCATSVFSAPLRFIHAEKNHHRDTEDTEIHREQIKLVTFEAKLII